MKPDPVHTTCRRGGSGRMVFQVNVAADVFGSKENTQLEFPTRPSLSELAAVCEAVYDTELRSRRREGTPDVPFHVQQLQHHDLLACQWAELYSQLQLVNGSQVFAFQPQMDLHSDSEELVPAPMKRVTWMAGCEPVTRCAVPPMDPTARREAAFAMICSRSHDTAVSYWGLRQALDESQITLCTLAVGDILTGSDVDRDGKLNGIEWQLFSDSNPGLVDAIYFRLSDAQGRYPSVASALDDEIQREKDCLQQFTKQEREARLAQQKRTHERLSQGKTSYVTNFEKAQQERFLRRLADEDLKKKQEADKTRERMLRAEAAQTPGGRGRETSPTRRGGALSPAKVPMPLAARPGMPRPAGPRSPALRKGKPKSPRIATPRSPAGSVSALGQSVPAVPPPSFISSGQPLSRDAIAPLPSPPPAPGEPNVFLPSPSPTPLFPSDALTPYKSSASTVAGYRAA